MKISLTTRPDIHTQSITLITDTDGYVLVCLHHPEQAPEDGVLSLCDLNELARAAAMLMGGRA